MSSAPKIPRFQTALPESEEVLEEIREIVFQRSGIFLDQSKNYLIENRLKARLAKLQMNSLAEYLRVIRADAEELAKCIESITTHKTEWFREIVHFQWLKTELPKLKNSGKPLFFWSAAASSGQEAYSLMLFLVRQGLCHNDFKILGTDISRPILAKAQSLPQEAEFAEQVHLMLARSPNRDWEQRELELTLNSSIKFRQFNLIEDDNLDLKFHLIFLRNVLIYFSRPVVIEVYKKMCRHLKPGGFLIIGLSESLGSEIPELVFLGNSIYQFAPRRPE
jgi:chemotaxis protein methyltransferase CheR